MKLNFRHETTTGTIGAMLRLERAPQFLINAILKAFTFKNPAYEAALRFGVAYNIPEKIFLAFKDTEHSVVFPRGFAAHEKLNAKEHLVYTSLKWTQDLRSEAPCQFPMLLVDLNHEQKTMRSAIRDAIDRDLRPFGNFFLQAPTGVGKCLGKGTKVLLFDGQTVEVEYLRVGDKLMGPDSKPRTIVSVCRGRERLYEVVPNNGKSYVVNESHILSLKMTGGTKSRNFAPGSVHNIPLRDYLKKSKTFKHIAKGWRTGVAFKEQRLPRNLPPYFLGLWLGDGSSIAAAVTTKDVAIVRYLLKFAWSVNCNLRKAEHEGNKSATYYISKGSRCSGRFWRSHPVTKWLRHYRVLENKHIPLTYLANSRVNRLALLAGIIDSDGHLGHSNVYEITQVNENLARDIHYLAGSLGLQTTIKRVVKDCQTGATGVYWRVFISGDLSELPLLLKYKKQKRSKPSSLRYGFNVKPLGVGDYYGFTLKEDGLFLLDDFTVTHNTIGQAACAAALGQRTLILVDTDQVKRTWYSDLKKAYGLDKNDIGLIQQNKWVIKDPFTIASIRTLAKRIERWDELYNVIGTVILDEVDIVKAPSFYSFVLGFAARYIIGATATADAKNFYLTSIFGKPLIKLQSTDRDTATSIRITEAKVIDTRFQYEYQRQNIDWNDMSMAMLADEERNQLIVKQLRWDVASGEVCIVATPRVAHLRVFKDMLIESGFEEKIIAIISGETNTDRKYTDKVMRDIFKGRIKIVLASLKAVVRGANINPLSCAHVVMPLNKKDLEQLLGRIRRKHPGKNAAKVRYYRDRRVEYLDNRYLYNALPVFSHHNIEGFQTGLRHLRAGAKESY